MVARLEVYFMGYTSLSSIFGELLKMVRSWAFG